MVNLTQEQLMARKARIISVTNTAGWRDILQVAEEAVQKAERAALECQKEDEVVKLQRKAQAAREFVNEFLKGIEISKQVETPDAEFIPVNY